MDGPNPLGDRIARIQGGQPASPSSKAQGPQEAFKKVFQEVKGAKEAPPASEMQTFLEAAKEIPDVREAKVQALKEEIARGTYRVSPHAVADAMLRELGLSDGGSSVDDLAESLFRQGLQDT